MTSRTINFNSPRVSVFSDLHLGVHQNSSTWHKIAIDWVQWYADELKKNNIEDIIFCGDFFHHRDEISVETLDISALFLEYLKDFNIVMFPGNHDCMYKDRADVHSLKIFNKWENVCVITKPTQVELFDKKLMFCPWGTEIEDIENSDIVFGHFEIQNFKFNKFRVNVKGMKYSDLLKKSDLVISGHFHLGEVREYKDGTIIYLGNPFQMDFGDSGCEKGYYLLNLKTNHYEFKPNTISPRYQKIQLSEIIKEEKITDNVKSWFRNNFVKLIVDKAIQPEHAEILLTKLNQLNPIDIDVDYAVNFNKFIIQDDEKDLSGIDTEVAIHEFINLLDIKNKDAIIDYTVDLYRKCIR